MKSREEGRNHYRYTGLIGSVYGGLENSLKGDFNAVLSMIAVLEGFRSIDQEAVRA